MLSISYSYCQLGTLILVLVSCLATAQAQADKQADKQVLTAEEIFDRNRLLEVDIELNAEDWDELRFQSREFATALMRPAPPSPYTWLKAKRITVNGHEIHDVAIRKKGFIGSQDTERPSLKIKFDEYKDQNPILDLDRLTLNNNKQDRSFVSQYLTYKLFAAAKLPASRCSLAKVTVNGKLLGIYSNVESVRKPMLSRVFGDSSGKLYEGTVTDFMASRIDDFEAKTTGEEDDRAELAALARLLSTEGDMDLVALGKIVSVDEFLRFWALESLIGFWDGYTNNQNNYFVYFHATDSRFHFVPWGTDAAFTNGGIAKQFKQGAESVHSQAFLPNRLYNTQGIANRYKATMLELMDEVWDEAAILAEVEHIEKLVKGNTHQSQADYPQEIQQARDFVESRREQIKRELDAWPRKISKQPREPFYTAKIGKAIGRFNTKWLENPPSDPYDIGEAELELTLNGEPVTFLRLGVHAIQSQQPGMDGKKPPTVVFVGKRESNKIRMTLGVGTDAANFRTPTGKPVAAQGILLQGAWFLGKFQLASGTITLNESGTDPGDTVRGAIEVEIVQMKGDIR